MAPKDIPKITKITPNHLPNMNPEKIARGDPKPAANVQIIENNINSVASRYKLDFFVKSKYIYFL